MTAPLKVGVNLLWLVPGVVGGSEGYATGLLERLVTRDDVTPVAFALPAFAQHYPELAAALSTVIAPLPEGRHVIRRVLAENGWLSRQLRVSRVDIAHHLGGIVPAASRIPTVVTLHDLQYLAYPAYFSATKRRYLQATQGRSLKSARAVTCISEFTRAEAIGHFQLDASKVTVVPPVVRPVVPASDHSREAARAAFDLLGDVVFYPAAMYPHKNHAVLLNAFAQVAAQREATLVLTGASGAGAWGSARSTEPHLRALADELGIAKKVRFLGYVDADTLAALYAEASVVAFPSRFEGFGLPVVEAMSAGCPVVAADATALPALVGEAGLLVAPDDVGGWAQAISTVLSDDVERARLVAAGSARAAALAAVDPVEPLIAAYRTAAG